MFTALLIAGFVIFALMLISLAVLQIYAEFNGWLFLPKHLRDRINRVAKLAREIDPRGTDGHIRRGVEGHFRGFFYCRGRIRRFNNPWDVESAIEFLEVHQAFLNWYADQCRLSDEKTREHNQSVADFDKQHGVVAGCEIPSNDVVYELTEDWRD